MREEHMDKLEELGLWLNAGDRLSVEKNVAAERAIGFLRRDGNWPTDDQIREYVALAHKDVDEGGTGI